MRLAVEESGALEPLRDRLALEDAPDDALNLFCHGDITKDDPVLALESIEGGSVDLTTGAAFISALGDKKPPTYLLVNAPDFGNPRRRPGSSRFPGAPPGGLRRGLAHSATLDRT